MIFIIHVAVYCHKYADFMPNFECVTVRYHPKPFISSVIESKEHYNLVHVRTLGY